MPEQPAGTVALFPPSGGTTPTYFPKSAVANQIAKGWKEKPGRKATKKSDKPKREQGTEKEK